MATAFVDSRGQQQPMLFGHPAGLFILFFTEMWERFSYYGMRALLVLYLASEISEGGLGWSNGEASKLYGWYTMLVYITPILGGIIADKFWGFRKAIMVGAILMTAGHLSLAFEPLPAFFLGLGLLIVGNGFFKPNISSIVGQLYPAGHEKKDGGYTIFYQGINVGAFLGTLLCGYLGESDDFGWHWGFGAAGVFMFVGLIQFWIAQKMFGVIGLSKKQEAQYIVDHPELIAHTSPKASEETNPDVLDDNPDAISKRLSEASAENKNKSKVERQRLIVVGILAFFSIFFWAAFEQAGSSMNIVANDYTDRSLTGSGAETFKIIATILQLLPVVILTILFIGLIIKLGKKYLWSLVCMFVSVAILWAIMLYIIYDQFVATETEVPATWFQSLNALFIFTLAPIFSKIWTSLGKSRLNPNGPQKFAIGLVLLGLGFVPMVIGTAAIPLGAESANTGMQFLVLAYLLHTMGELALSPVGLSYVNKLSPARLLGLMFGIWFFASAMGNMAAGQLASVMDSMKDTMTMSDFFQIFVYIPIAAGIVLFILGFPLKKLMHGVK